MVEQKEIDNKKLDETKSEKPINEVKDTEDKSPIKEGKKDQDLGNAQNDKDKSAGEDKKQDASDKDVKDTKKKEKIKPATGPKKEEAVVNGRDLRISTKHSIAVCNFIRNKNIDIALIELDQVSLKKRAIPMRGEIPHRKGKMMSGRYPINAVKAFTMLLKSLKANAINHELELEKVKIACMPNYASRPATRFGQGRHKRSHVQIKLIPMGKKK